MIIKEVGKKNSKKVEITVCGKTFVETIPRNVSSSMQKKYVEYLRGMRKLEEEGAWKFTDMDGNEHRLPLSPTALKKMLPRVPEDRRDELKKKNTEASNLKERLLVLRNECINGRTSNTLVSKKKALIEEYSPRILEMLGKGWTAAEVHKTLLEEGADIKYESIQLLHSQNKTQISEKRREWNEDIKDVTLYSKRCRLEKLSYLMNELMEDFSHENKGLVRTKAAGEIRQIIDQARKEVEGEEVNLTVSGKIDIEATIALAQSQKGICEGLTIAQLVIARAAARLGVRSQYFIDHLSKSWYSKWGGFRRNEDLRTKPHYPTETVYDIMDIGMEQKNLQWKNEQVSYEIDDQSEEGGEGQRKDEMRRKLIELLEKR